jgi:hypothetical protein
MDPNAMAVEIDATQLSMVLDGMGLIKPTAGPARNWRPFPRRFLRWRSA